jgi:mannose-1-phosphate guanylyltransferase
MDSKPWGIILAGGDGTRLRSLSQLIAGDDRPKQFCNLFGSRSLLSRTRWRVRHSIPHQRTLFVVVREHEKYYAPELVDVDASRIVVQPANRGTTAAITYGLLRLTRLANNPVVAIFPSDHHFADEEQFRRALDNALGVVRKHPGTLVLLGARADKAEVGYGWIEPGPPLDKGDEPHRIFRVNRFWEKPSAERAEELLASGCLWNTFVIVGRAEAFLEAIDYAAPHTLRLFHAVAIARTKEEEREHAEALYKELPSSDFSRQVLTNCAHRLAVLRLDRAGWGDLGTPEGVLAALRKTSPMRSSAEANAFETWMRRYRHHLEELCRHSGPEKARSADGGGH